MKPSPEISDNASEILRSHIYESDNVDFCNLNVYEFQEGEDLYGSRSLGYQKPKHMWMAKDQAFTNSKPTSPIAAANSTDFGIDIFPNQSTLGSRISNPVSKCPSPINPAYTVESPCTSSSVQGLSVTLSSYTNTSSSLSSHTPPNGTCITEVVSSCTSPSSIKSDCINGNLKSCKKTKVFLNIKSKGKSKNVVSDISLPEEKLISCSMHTNSIQERRNRQSRSNRKNKRSVKNGKLTLKLSTPSLNLSIIDSAPSQATELIQTEHFPLHSSDNASRSPPNLPSPPGACGLKIRLRRDSGHVDSSSCRNKKAKNKVNSTTFRIVESWCDADAPGGDYSRRVRAITGNSTSPTFNFVSGGLRVGDIVWAKLAGYPYWPSQISAIWARTAHQLSQATLLPTFKLLDNNRTSLAILATPHDPTLASGYTARVEWLAWDQCSYLSCAKLYPFKDAFDKLYNPRTRVKGYAEAIRLAKRFVNGTYISTCDNTDSQVTNLSPRNKSHSSISSQLSAPPSTDSQWSAMTTLSSSLEPSIPGPNNSISRESSDTNQLLLHMISASETYTLTQSSVSLHPNDGTISQNKNIHSTHLFCATSEDSIEDHMDLPDLGNIPLWAPLPQLDVSGLGVFHVPTFSEDEEDFDQPLVNHLEFDFGSCI